MIEWKETSSTVPHGSLSPNFVPTKCYDKDGGIILSAGYE